LDAETDPVQFGDLSRNLVAAKNLAVAGPRIERKTLERVRATLEYAQRLIFLGFGFWSENLDVLHDRTPESNTLWHSKQILASCFHLWRSTKIDVDSRLGYRAGQTRPLINWGNVDQDLFNFVTHWNLKGSGND
jgi:hypothetical protein